MAWLRVLSALIVSLVALSCGGGDEKSAEPAEDEVEVVPFRSTRMLEEADVASLVIGEDGLLTFEDVPDALADVEPGQVLVAGRTATTPEGLLRVVKSVRSVEGGLELETLHAPLQLAFRKVHIKSAPRSTGQLGSESWPGSLEPLAFDPFKRHVGATQEVSVVVFDGDGDVDTTDDQVVVDGELGGSIEFAFRLDFDWGALEDLPGFVKDCVLGLLGGEGCDLMDLLPEAKAVFDATPSLAAHLELHGAAILDFQKDFVLYQSNLGVLVYGPVIVTPHVQIVARAEGSASGAFRAQTDAAISFKTAVTLSSKNAGKPDFQPPELEDVSVDAEPPEVTLTARAQAGLGAELSLLIYGVTGPFLSARAFGAVDADVFREPCVELSAGLEGSLGVKFTTPAFLFIDPIELLKWEATLGPLVQTLDVPVPVCEVPPNASMLPPGSGPDAEHLANPTFEPWSRSFDALGDSLVSLTGGTTTWLDAERTIDDRVVITSRYAPALVKLDQSGAIVWSRTYLADRDNPNSALRPARVTASRDAGLWVVAEARLPPVSVLKLTQAGNVLFRREIDVPDAGSCGIDPRGLARDGADGVYVVLTCALNNKVYLVHLDGRGELLDAMSFTDEESTSIVPAVAIDAGGELFVSGRISRPLDSMFALRLAGDGTPAFTNRYEACTSAPDVYPVHALVDPNGEVTVAGRGGAEHNGFLARIRRDGSVGFSAFPGFGFGVGSVFMLDSIAELPTTGYVVSGSAVQFTSDEPASTPGLALLQLDAVGTPVWARRYTLKRSDGSYVRAGHTDLVLTDDGGILAFAATQRDETGLTSELWSMKLPAKDGAIGFDDAAARHDSLPVAALPCSLSRVDWDITTQSEPDITATAVETDAVDHDVTARSQTP